MPGLKENYQKLLPELMQSLKIDNVFRAPRIRKVCLNMGLGEKGKNKVYLEEAVADLSLISGQRACITYAKAGIATFKIREGWPIGVKVTLRRSRMYEFLDRLICVAIPRIRDFRGFSNKSFDKQGNYNIGIKQHIIFPEIDSDKSSIKGLDISINISSRSQQDSVALLKSISFPIRV